MENFRDPVVPKKKAKTPAVFFVIPPARLSRKTARGELKHRLVITIERAKRNSKLSSRHDGEQGDQQAREHHLLQIPSQQVEAQGGDAEGPWSPDEAPQLSCVPPRQYKTQYGYLYDAGVLKDAR
jgi:hypothetical protein